jgi:TRAP-type C4-dicarboxylate transport system permease small subunit
MLGMIVLGPISWLATKKLGWDLRRRTGAVVASLALAALLAPAWRDAGVDYFGHMFNWLQEGSSLTLFGQLRGVSTRLTVLLAMIGASLAAAGGKHINIDAFLRFVPKRLLLPTFVASSIATAAVCFAAAWGFFENIAINNFGAEREWKYDKKIEIVEKRVAQDLFIWRLQIGFDLESLPIVLGGGKWDDESRLNGKQWNELVESSGYRDHFTKEQVDALLAPPEALGESRLPMVVVPDNSPRGLLVHTMNLTFPIGFVIVGLRFLLRLILVLAGVETLDPDVAGISDEKPDARPKAGAAAEEKA